MTCDINLPHEPETFTHWLYTQTERDDDIGMFAQAVKCSTGMPCYFQGPESLSDYLRATWQAGDDVVSAGLQAWHAWQESLPENARWRPKPAEDPRHRDFREKLVLAAANSLLRDPDVSIDSAVKACVRFADAVLGQMEKP